MGTVAAEGECNQYHSNSLSETFEGLDNTIRVKLKPGNREELPVWFSMLWRGTTVVGGPHRSLGRDGMCELTGTQSSSHPVLRFVGDAAIDCSQRAARYLGA
jgi:hypothetical protein